MSSVKFSSSSSSGKKCVGFVPGFQGVTSYYYQEGLPQLPIPDLQTTCMKYLKSAKELCTQEEYEEAVQNVNLFIESDGPQLQEKLVNYGKEQTSYVKKFWLDGYLDVRSSVVLHLNPFFILEDDPTPSRNNQVSRAASLIVSSLKFIRALRNESLEPDMWRNDIPLCMDQFKYLFGCGRIPTERSDHVKQYSNSKHIVVLCRKQFYWFDVIWEDGTQAITEVELCQNLRMIREDAQKVTDEEAALHAVGVLTTEERATWARLRTSLENLNVQNLEVVDSALFLVCLDDESPTSGEDAASIALHGSYRLTQGIQTGSCTNRWYDKLQLVVCKNGVAGVNFEHSFIDGHTVLRYVSDIFTDTIIRFAQSIRGCTISIFDSAYKSPLNATDPARPDIHPKRLQWNLSKDVVDGIKYAESRLSDLILQNEMKVLEFNDYGKLFITSHNLSPDAFVQLAFTASYYDLYGSLANQYEPVLTKRFLHGRTEAARGLTKEAVMFTKTFCSDATPLAKIDALRNAVTAHCQLVKESAAGMGLDRHLFALHCLWRQDMKNKMAAKPPMFDDAVWKKMNNFTLSTSNCGNPSLRLFGFGPVSPDGFGLGYVIKDEGIQVCASSRHRQTERFLLKLKSYFHEIQALLMSEHSTKCPNLAIQKRSRVGKSYSRNDEEGYGFWDSGALDEKDVIGNLPGRRL